MCSGSARDRAEVVIPYAVRLGELFPNRVEAHRLPMLVSAQGHRPVALRSGSEPRRSHCRDCCRLRAAYELLAEPLSQHVAGTLPPATQKFFKALYERRGPAKPSPSPGPPSWLGVKDDRDGSPGAEGRVSSRWKPKAPGSKPNVYKSRTTVRRGPANAARRPKCFRPRPTGTARSSLAKLPEDA